jgi:hypothetical protein
MNLEQKVDAILAAVSTPPVIPAPVVDFTPVLTAIAAVQAGITDIQGQVDEPPVSTPAPTPAPTTAP